MTADEMKRAAAEAAIAYVPEDAVVGVGTGSTVNHFIEALGSVRDRIPGAKFTVLDAAHISSVEQANAFNAEVLGFLAA